MTESNPPAHPKSQAIAEMLNDQFIRVWDIYIKFHSLWLAANLVGLGIQIQHVTGIAGKVLFAVAFAVAHALTAVTAVRMMKYSEACCTELDELGYEQLTRFRPLSRWGGKANMIVYLAFIVIWAGSVFVTKDQPS